MTVLMQIQSFIQAYVMAVSSILDTEVTVVDDQMVRVGGTGYYKKEIGKRISHDSFFQTVLATGRFGVVENVREAFACSSCRKRASCEELANLAYPIFLGENVVGVVGIVAFHEQERERLLRDLDKLEEFVKYMSILIESKIVTLQHNFKLENQISEVVNNDISQADRFIGDSWAIREMLALADKVSASTSTVLISGESGVGKEMLAKRIHAASPRRGKLMLSLNCAAIPDSLVESELFGYEEGAFTGAKKQGHMGKFELATMSTLFLDEIGEIPPHVQTKLLRVLQEQVVERIGGKKSIPIDVRIICATNRDLPAMVEAGRFRRDLYYRLNVIPITIPPLRQRRDDIPLYIRHFIERYNRMLNKKLIGLEPEAERLLLEYDWPGNVRELRNIIEYLENIVDGGVIRVSDLPGTLRFRAASGTIGKLDEMMADYERSLLGRLMESNTFASDKSVLAERLGVSRATLYRKLSSHGLL